jgi:hypothetical protein
MIQPMQTPNICVVGLSTYHIFSNTSRTFFPNRLQPKTGGCAAYTRITKLVTSRLHQAERGRGGGGGEERMNIRALVSMRLNTSLDQCPIETFTFPPTRQAKPANRRVRMYVRGDVNVYVFYENEYNGHAFMIFHGW